MLNNSLIYFALFDKINNSFSNASTIKSGSPKSFMPSHVFSGLDAFSEDSFSNISIAFLTLPNSGSLSDDLFSGLDILSSFVRSCKYGDFSELTESLKVGSVTEEEN